MRLYKPEYTDKGRKCKAKRWYLDFRDHLDRRQRLPLSENKDHAKDIERNIKLLIDYRTLSRPLPDELERWVSQQPEPLRIRLRDIGLLQTGEEAHYKPLSEHIEDYEQYMKSTKSDKYGVHRESYYIATSIQRIKAICDGCGFKRWDQIKLTEVKEYLGKLDISPNTQNHYRQAIRQFAEWMIEDNRANHSPLLSRKWKAVKVAQTEIRRAFNIEELRKLMDHVISQGPRLHGMSGYDRAVLYAIALETGYRASELSKLTVRSFDPDNRSLSLNAEQTKGKRDAEQYLHKDTADMLKKHVSGLKPSTKLLRMPRIDALALMIRKDCEAAGINTGGIVFHCFRNTLATMLDSTDATLKERMEIMRHSDKGNLTMGTYTMRPTAKRLKAIIDQLPAVKLAVKTGQESVGKIA